MGQFVCLAKTWSRLFDAPPIAGKVVLGRDPAFRTGCKLAVVDETGKVLDTIVVFPTEPQNKVAETKRIVKAMIEKYNISLISVGNGTASRESELVIVDMLKELNRPVQYIITNEAERRFIQRASWRQRNFRILTWGREVLFRLQDDCRTRRQNL